MLDMLRDTDAIPWMVYGSSACVLADNDRAVHEQTVPLAETRFATFPTSGPSSPWVWPSTVTAGLPTPSSDS